MAREYQSHRQYGPFAAEFGRWTITPTSAEHVYVDANHNSATDLDSPDGLRITIRGIPYGVSAHLYRQPDGTWCESTRDDDLSLYMSRLDRYRGPRDLYPSASAMNAVRAKLYPLVVEWLETDAGQEALAQADKVDANNATRAAEIEREKVVAELRRLDRTIRENADRL